MCTCMHTYIHNHVDPNKRAQPARLFASSPCVCCVPINEDGSAVAAAFVEENQTLSTLSSILNFEWQLIRSDLLLLAAAA